MKAFRLILLLLLAGTIVSCSGPKVLTGNGYVKSHCKMKR